MNSQLPPIFPFLIFVDTNLSCIDNQIFKTSLNANAVFRKGS